MQSTRWLPSTSLCRYRSLLDPPIASRFFADVQCQSRIEREAVLTSNIEHPTSNLKSHYDVVILGAGHNGLVAATYLGRAGLSVLLLEKNDYIGGATTSQKVFPDYDARLSRYSYLVSLFPKKIIRELGLNLELRRRATGSFTPYVKDGRHDGLLLSNVDEETSEQSMFELTGNRMEHEQMKRFYNLSRVFAEHSWDSMIEPLVAKEEIGRAHV